MARVKTPEEVRKICIERITNKYLDSVPHEDKTFIVSDFSKYLADELGQLESIKASIRQNGINEQKAKKEYDAALKFIMDERKAVESVCPHYSKTYYADPAGGRDSHETCDICGKRFE